MTTIKQLNLLNELRKKERRQAYIHWAVEGITDEDIKFLQDDGFLLVTTGDGFVGGLKTLSLTREGQKFIEDFCSVCECMPCDCGYGS